MPRVDRTEAEDRIWSRPPSRLIRLLLRTSGLAAVGLGGWYLWWRLDTLAGTGAFGVTFLVVEVISWAQFASIAVVALLARWRRGPLGPPFGTMDVFITVCGEPMDMVERTLRAALDISYPHRTYVLNDGWIAGKRNWREAEDLARRYGAEYLSRSDGGPGKAANLNHALARTDGDWIVTIDADHVAVPDLAEQTVGYLADPRVGFVATYQRFRTAKRDVLNNREPLFYTVIQPAKDAADCAISCGNGTVYRRAALVDIGGFSEWNYVEDLHTSYRLHAAGWTSVYHPRPVTTGTAPETAAEFMAQRQRWAMDSLRLFFRDCPLWKHGLRWSHRLHYLQTTSWYLVGLLQLGFVAASLGYAFTRLSLVNAPSQRDYLVHAAPYLSTVLLFLVVGQRGLAGAVRGIGVLLFTAPMFVAAAVRVLTGGRPATALSLKRRGRRMSAQLLAPLALLVALTAGLANLLWDNRSGVSPVGVFWVAVSAFLLAGPAATVTWRPHGSAVLRTGLRGAIAGALALALPAVAVLPVRSAPVQSDPLRADSVAVPESFVVPPAPQTPAPAPAAPAPAAPQQLLAPASGAYFGVTASTEVAPPVEALRTAPVHRVHIVQWFQQWRSGEVRLRTDWLAAVDRMGSVPMIVWEPWARPPDGYAEPVAPDSRVDVIASGRYDAYIRSWARGLAEYRRPVLVKFMHEMNGLWYPWSVNLNGNTPAGYVRAWRHVHDLFREAGATNVSWVWSLNTEMGFRHQTLPPESYYPGPEYVDWVGISGMNWGTSQPWSGWTNVDTLFRDDYRRLSALGKPIMITEISTVERGGDGAAWVTETMTRFRTSYPAVRAVVWFDQPYTAEVDFRLGRAARAALARALAEPYWRGELRLAPKGIAPNPQTLPSRGPGSYVSYA